MFKYITDNPIEAGKAITRLAARGEDGVVVHVCKEPCVWIGADLGQYDKSECTSNGIPVASGYYNGGAIVNFPGDVTASLTTWGNNDFGQQTVEHFRNRLSSLGIDSFVDNNDLIANDKKVVSWARATFKTGYCQSYVHFSIGTIDIELISKICKKEIKKMPGSLMELGVSTEDVLKELEALCNVEEIRTEG